MKIRISSLAKFSDEPRYFNLTRFNSMIARVTVKVSSDFLSASPARGLFLATAYNHRLRSLSPSLVSFFLFTPNGAEIFHIDEQPSEPLCLIGMSNATFVARLHFTDTVGSSIAFTTLFDVDFRVYPRNYRAVSRRIHESARCLLEKRGVTSFLRTYSITRRVRAMTNVFRPPLFR